MALEARTCGFCGAMTPPSITLTPHRGEACPLKVAEHELRMKILETELVAAETQGKPVITLDVSKMTAKDLERLPETLARLAERGFGLRA